MLAEYEPIVVAEGEDEGLLLTAADGVLLCPAGEDEEAIIDDEIVVEVPGMFMVMTVGVEDQVLLCDEDVE